MKYSIDTSAAPEAIGPYSQGTTAGRFVFTSGQLPIDPHDSHRLITGDIQKQTERVIEIIADLLADANCPLSYVTQTTIYLTSLNDLSALDEVYERYFTAPAPSRSVVGVSFLPMGSLIEMSCIACR